VTFAFCAWQFAGALPGASHREQIARAAACQWAADLAGLCRRTVGLVRFSNLHCSVGWRKCMGQARWQQGQQHPISVYLSIWLLLFVLSTMSYLVDYFHLHGYLRWSLIVIFMLLKAGLIVGIFMHMASERLALRLAIIVPPLCLLVLVGVAVGEGEYTFVTRLAEMVQ